MNNCKKSILGGGIESIKVGWWERVCWYFIGLERRLVWLECSEFRRELFDRRLDR